MILFVKYLIVLVMNVLLVYGFFLERKQVLLIFVDKIKKFR